MSVAAVCLVLLALFGCRMKPPTGAIFENQWPRVYLANVPPDSSQLPHAPTVYWYGSDADGFIIAYQWAIDDTSVWYTLKTDSELGTRDTVAFPAPLPDTEFTHVFYVRAMDDDSAVTAPDAIPHRVFRVSNKAPVSTTIEEGPANFDSMFVIRDTIQTWDGIHFKWSTVDSDQVFAPKFSWRWDDGAWSEWSEVMEKYFVGKDDTVHFMKTGNHTFQLRAMDDAMAVDSSCAPITIYVAVPTFARKLLVFDATRNGAGTQGQPTDEQVDAFYDTVLTNAGWPDYYTADNSSKMSVVVPHDTIGLYRMILVHSDDIAARAIPEAYILQDYLSVGGRLFIGGYQTLEVNDPPFTVSTYLGIDSATVNGAFDFVGAIPVNATEYEYLEVEPNKLLPAWNGAIGNVGIYHLKNIFDAVYEFDSKVDSTEFEGRAATIFRLDYDEEDHATFKTVAASFPLYDLKIDANGEPLASTMRELLNWLDE
jgi:hypothetical protein